MHRFATVVNCYVCDLMALMTMQIIDGTLPSQVDADGGMLELIYWSAGEFW